MLRIVESWDGCLVAVWEGSCSLGGERCDGKEEEEETEEESVGRLGVYNGFSDGITDGSHPSVILSMMPSVKVPRHCTDISV